MYPSQWRTLARDFYPRSPCGERRPGVGQCPPHHDFYPRSPCGERHSDALAAVSTLLISIHALLAESDVILVILIN